MLALPSIKLELDKLSKCESTPPLMIGRHVKILLSHEKERKRERERVVGSFS